ncbi:hypothetical protein [Thalassospira xiamenensis]|uniref:hypothetical protein n=1 Tax=Thalassospira xiamenensis TaxID=220697 RepID=UPI003AA8E71A
MTSPILNDTERTRFATMAIEMLEQNISPALIRTRLADEFGMTGKQVQNALSRQEIKLSHATKGRKRLRDLSSEDLDGLVALAKEFHSQGMHKDEIRMRVAARFNVYERSVTTRCLKAGLDIRTDFSLANAAEYSAEPKEVVRLPSLEESDVGDKKSGNKFAEAASRVAGARYSRSTGKCFLNGVRISGIELVKKAGLELSW